MSNVINFLERMGQDAGLCHLSGAELDMALDDAGLAPAIETAIRNQDAGQLEALMGQVPLCAAFFPGEDEEEREEEKEETPPRESEESSQRSRLHALAAAG